MLTRAGVHDLNRASRKAEEAAGRRFQAVEWLESLVGPIGVSKQPSEREFVSCLRNGIALCNAINKIKPGAVPKVVENHSPVQSVTWESQPLPAFQYFENIRNFLVAVEELKIPAFEASNLERDTLELGSAAKVVDCILALKAYHEWKQSTGGNGFFNYIKSPVVFPPTNRNQSGGSAARDSCRWLDMSSTCENQPPLNDDAKSLEDIIAMKLADRMVNSKENFDDNLLASLRSRNLDAAKLFSKLISNYLDKPVEKIVPEIKSMSRYPLIERDGSNATPTTLPQLSTPESSKCCRACFKIGNCNHKHQLSVQEKELLDLKTLLSKTKTEFKDMETQLLGDMKNLENQVAELSTAALGYHKVLKENRNLYNMVQDLKGNIRVYCRIRPSFSQNAASVIDFLGEDGSLVIQDPLKLNKDGKKIFQFNQVFGPKATQGDVYEDIQPLIRSVMDGYNVCIFAYGQTGSGKTYTMSGPSGGSAEDKGVNYLALNELFQISHTRSDILSYDIHVQMVEIYNEQVRDLLAEDSSNVKLEIRSCIGNDGLSIPDATMRAVKSSGDVLDLMRLGEVNRVVGATAMNNRSSRSHSVLTVHVHGKDTSGGTLRSCLHLVDLAGSERVDKSEVTGDRLKEAQCINKSLSCLGDVIMALAQKNSHIPYRNSKLTLLLQGSLGGNAKSLMFAHVSPEIDSFGETISTLKFAQRVSTVELGAARSNKESSEVIKLKEQIESLKKELANREAKNVQIIRTELSPPHSRRMIIENSNAQKSEDKRGQKTPLPTRARRLSLEVPRYAKTDNLHMNKPLPSSGQKYSQFQGAEAVSKSPGNFSNSGSSTEISHPSASRSPTSSACQQRLLRTHGKTDIPKFQLPKSPKPPMSKNEVQIVVQSEITLSTEFHTSNVNRSTNSKGSQIRKSLRTIGKLINGSDKRNHKSVVELQTPKNSTGKINETTSPLAANTVALRRRSLIGVQGSSGVKQNESNGDGMRNSKTPPPIRQSTKTMKRWM